LLVVAVALCAAATTPACATEVMVTAQARADQGAFLSYAPPPAARAGLCLVDTGVDLNPDTEGVVVDRLAVEGASISDASPSSHGTVMAMLAGAPLNGWGMLGTAPGAIQIVSVGILSPGQSTFPLGSYAAGITTCLQAQARYDIRVINLSLGTSQVPSGQEYQSLGNAIERASDYGVAVIAAAGNDDGGPVGYPAAYPGVLSVAASDTQTGQFCSFSNHGPGLRLTAPGCDLDAADPNSGAADYNYWQGTSEASAIAAAALTALYAYQPTLTPTAGEEALTSADAGVLDIACAFRDAGLQQLVSEGEANEPQTPSLPAPEPLSTTPAATATPAPAARAAQTVGSGAPASALVRESQAMKALARFPRPRVRLARRASKLAVNTTGRPVEAQTEIQLLTSHARHKHRALWVTWADTTSLTAPPSGDLRVRYVDPYDAQRAGPWLTLPLRGVHP
jgi:hypothetical protein